MAKTYYFSEAKDDLKLTVGRKGTVIVQKGESFDSSVWRYDICGNVMKFSEHGNTQSKYGWEIDHIMPQAKGGSDEITNLQPLYWENNRMKSDSYPWSCGD